MSDLAAQRSVNHGINSSNIAGQLLRDGVADSQVSDTGIAHSYVAIVSLPDKDQVSYMTR